MQQFCERAGHGPPARSADGSDCARVVILLQENRSFNNIFAGFPGADTSMEGRSGCSTIYATPRFQDGIDTGCADRAQADVAADASPNTGVAVYDSFHQRGWEVFGGTSVATPIVASVFALAGRTHSNDPGSLYAHSGLGSPNGIAAF
jgi:subtilase family serine protease